MATVVTGLSQHGDIAALKAALHEAGLSLDHIQVIGPDDSTASVAHGLAGAELLTGEGQGTGVPGINNARGNRAFLPQRVAFGSLGRPRDSR